MQGIISLSGNPRVKIQEGLSKKEKWERQRERVESGGLLESSPDPAGPPLTVPPFLSQNKAKSHHLLMEGQMLF